ncbi:LysR family transcriptional regulator, chromosome initiation inhibitor [Jannaschia faecimaris]|uniref:LysR family transcriptional regulator, chromosome initiation inhibitor n=1 Tax=Jannaschia faecimaris TaxID=1244108 RepID=A0A1H3Q861_9RHOB|nr:LysR family transcriptional regulator ArgP [Jannaschia faecimaris]SDZ09724.1 LysR family transcriptional regulator, chromosome initiation inhibitor [Jannaschia faecimaris]
MLMIAPQLMTTLIAVVETGSFDMAAARLRVTPPAVSQRMRALAEAAGGPVFARLQPAVPTDLGRRLMRHARDMAALQADLSADLGQDGGPRPVSIALNADSLEVWAVPPLASCPGFRFDICILDQDHSAEVLRRGEVSAALTTRADPLPGCDAHPLGALRYRATCTPAFHARYFAKGVTAQALIAAPSLRFTALDALQKRWIARQTGQPIDPPAHHLAAPGPFVQATREGLGWGLNPERLVAEDIAAGRLIELIPDTHLDTPLHWQVGRTMAEVLAPVTRAIRNAAREALI